MARKSMKIGMTPSHPGSFIKTEILDELELSITKAAEILGVRRATFSDLVHEKAALSPGVATGKSLSSEDGDAAPDEGLVRQQRDAQADPEGTDCTETREVQHPLHPSSGLHHSKANRGHQNYNRIVVLQEATPP